MSRELLDNPIWSSLITEQMHLASGGRLARRYEAQVAPFVGLASADEPAQRELLQFVEPGETIYVLATEPVLDRTVVRQGDWQGNPAGDRNWTLLAQANVVQMVWRAGSPAVDSADIVPLKAADTADMIALTTLVFPGFFRPRTPEMGAYFGIKHGERLAAMAGERMRLTGYQEISAVCTHPEFIGRGYAARLICKLVVDSLSLGITPFLHVNEGNSRARALYERLGFVNRTVLPMWHLRREPT